MSIPSTTNVSPLFLSTPPAWELKVKLRQALNTDIFTARSRLEQRQARQEASNFLLEYRVIMDREDSETRRVRSAAEIAAPLVVPFWPVRTVTTTDIIADVVTIERMPPAEGDFWAVGDFVFFDGGDEGRQFRQILSRAGAVLTLEADVLGFDFSAGATVWPCRLCVRDAGSAAFESDGEDSHEETYTLLTL